MYSHEAGFAYTIATGRLFCPMDEFHRRAEELMDRPIFTHEFGSARIWEEMREKFQNDALQAIS